MKKLLVEQSIQIKAPASIVWNVLTDPNITNEWIKEFSVDFTLLESDWKMGSTVLWKDTNGKAHVEGKVTALEPYKKLRFTVIPAGIVPDWEIKEEDGITYILTEKDNGTNLTIVHGDFGLMPEHRKYYEATVDIWHKVLPQIKNLAEWLKKLEHEGFKELRVCPIPGPDTGSEHTHDLPTVHIILNGELTVSDQAGTKKFKAGDRVEFPAGTTHKANGNSDNGSMIVGVKR